MKTLVIQSCRETDLPAWIEACLASVRGWAGRRGHDYRLIGDEIFELVPRWYLDKAGAKLPVATDYARLVLLRRALEEEDYDLAFWFDADVLVFDPALELDFADSCAFGRETWVQPDGRGGWRAVRNVHNAVCGFRGGCPVLPFLERSVLSLIRRADAARIAPQMAGPKLLTALHNIAGFSLLPQAGAFSPAVLGDIAAGGGPALELLTRESETLPRAANLCASVAEDGIAERAVERLLAAGAGLFRRFQYYEKQLEDKNNIRGNTMSDVNLGGTTEAVAGRSKAARGGITLDNITDAVINHGDGGKTNPRLHEIYASLVRHLHAFQKEVNLTTEELEIGRQFLFRLAQPNQDFPMGEIHLMSDCLGISELSILLEDKDNNATTEANVEGPLYIEGMPMRQSGDSIGEDENGDPLFIHHKVQDQDGSALAGAVVDIWQPNGEGYYFVQREHLPEWNFYASFTTDENGKFDYRTVVPGDYPVPTSGPTGSMLQQLGRHGYRAAHIHYMIHAKGHADFTTMMYMNHSPYVDSDTIFSVKDFRVDLQRHDSPEEMKARGVDKPFYTLDYTFVLP